jgi:hypothetical protein
LLPFFVLNLLELPAYRPCTNGLKVKTDSSAEANNRQAFLPNQSINGVWRHIEEFFDVLVSAERLECESPNLGFDSSGRNWLSF